MKFILKYIKSVEIPYWENRKLRVDLYLIVSDKNSTHKQLALTIWDIRRLTDYKGHEDEWGSNWWKHFTLWEWK